MSRGEGGQSPLEFALILPTLILIMLSIGEIGWYFIAKLAISHAAAKGARFAVEGFVIDPSEVEEEVRRAADGIGLREEDVTVMIAAHQTPGGIIPKYAIVEVTYTYKPILTGLIFGRRVTIRASAMRRYPPLKEAEPMLSPTLL